ncbi:MAG: TPM domain-containing protein [Desulfopila sp.]|jgi:uncharacterized protein|nr:TPM domain-containing protein [Desulfopila sp.]
MVFQSTRRAIFATFFCTILVFILSADTVFPLDVPPLQGRVNDFAEILSPATETQLDQILTLLEKTDSTQVVVLTLSSLQGEALENFSLKVVEQWQIGRAELDNGALLLIAVQDRKVRIEVGYGLEGTLTDLTAGRIIRNDILPYFKQGNFNLGVLAGVNAIVATVQGEYSSSGKASRQQQDDFFGILAMLMFFFFFIGNIFRKKKIAAAVAGGIGASVIGLLFYGFSLPLFLGLLAAGIVFGMISSKFHMVSGRSRSSGRIFSSGPGGFSSSGGFGGFGGGGGGFGGGGASGGW